MEEQGTGPLPVVRGSRMVFAVAAEMGGRGASWGFILDVAKHFDEKSCRKKIEVVVGNTKYPS